MSWLARVGVGMAPLARAGMESMAPMARAGGEAIMRGAAGTARAGGTILKETGKSILQDDATSMLRGKSFSSTKTAMAYNLVSNSSTFDSIGKEWNRVGTMSMPPHGFSILNPL